MSKSFAEIMQEHNEQEHQLWLKSLEEAEHLVIEVTPADVTMYSCLFYSQIRPMDLCLVA